MGKRMTSKFNQFYAVHRCICGKIVLNVRSAVLHEVAN